MSGFVSKMAERAPSWNLVQPVINIPKINRAPAKLFEKVSRGSTISKGRNNPPDLRHTHSASAKNCFQAPPRSLYGVNYLLMRDVLVTFMYVQLAGGRLSARPLTQPRRAPVFVRLVARTAGFSDPTRRLLPRRRMSSARPASAQQTRCSDHPRVGEHPGLSPVLDGSSCRAASRFKPETLRGEITLLPQRKVAARLTMQKAFHGHNTEPGSAARLGNFL